MYRHLEFPLEEYFQFTFVRNPFDRILSLFFYLVKDEKRNENIENNKSGKQYDAIYRMGSFCHST